MSVLIMINNYFHDVATAFLLATTLLMFYIGRQIDQRQNSALLNFYIVLYDRFTMIARIALVWIIIGGIPRVIFYKKIEWSIALGNGIVTALIVKHVLMFIAVATGIILWQKLARKIAYLKEIGKESQN